MNSRTERVRSLFKKEGLEALLVTKEANVSYLTGLPITNACALLTKRKNIIITDFRYFEEARQLKNFVLQKTNNSVMDSVISLAKKLKVKKLGFEANNLSYNGHLKIKKALRATTLVPAGNFVEKIRMIKETQELKSIEKAVKISRGVFSYIKRILREGISEKELSRKIDVFIRFHGGDGIAFPTIVASGPNSSRPHAVASNKKIKRNEPIIIDMGVRVSGYNSDLTRTFYLGKINSKFSHIYNIVYKAQQRAISYIKPGRLISELDRAARGFINRAGFSEHFGHALGHGIGREVHESPKIFKNAKCRLMPGMVFTIEPAIYLPGWGGVRIEDMVLVTKNGCKVLTNDIHKSI